MVNSANHISLYWADNANNETSYLVSRSIDGTNAVSFNLAANSVSFFDRGLQPNTAYIYTLTARNSAGDSAAISLSAGTPPNIWPQGERGLFFSNPNGGSMTPINTFLSLVNNVSAFRAMTPTSIKLPHARFQHFEPRDNTLYAYFPYDELRAYEQQLVASGEPPIFVTATLNGVSKPVYFAYGSAPDPLYPFHPVNLRDERYIRFWIDRYARPWLRTIGTPNTWISNDNCDFAYDLYGAYDSQGVFQKGIRWDLPFAQNESEFYDSIRYFFARVKTLAPEIKLACNGGGKNWDPAVFQYVFEDIDGVEGEDMQYFYQGSDSWYRRQVYNQFLSLRWAAESDKLALLAWQRLPNDSSRPLKLRTAYMHYLILHGSKFFFAPQDTITEVPPSEYSAMKTALGTPTGAPIVQHLGGSPGYTLYTRNTSKGIAFLNWTGSSRTIALPTTAQYVDRNGVAVTQITIADKTGDYVVLR